MDKTRSSDFNVTIPPKHQASTMRWLPLHCPEQLSILLQYLLVAVVSASQDNLKSAVVSASQDNLKSAVVSAS